METTEQDRVQQIIEDNTIGNMAGSKFTLDDLTQTIQPADYHDPDSPRNQVTEGDLGHASVRGG